jgi:glycosyltransferase involved in cell wall biosynthesis
MHEILATTADPRQTIMAGSRTGQDLADAYAAMDVFAFTSQSETQGMVLAEALAAGTPVVALDGPGVRDVMTRDSGRQLPADASEVQFAEALDQLTADRSHLRGLGESARKSVTKFGLDCCADRLELLYESLSREASHSPDADPGPWDRLLARIEVEWNLLAEKTSALAAVVIKTDATTSELE